MDVEIEIWRLVAGLGLFLFGMHELEDALKQLAGRPFKQVLRKYTARPLQGIVAGAVSTAALQSSSMVSLMVLAFIGSGIISLASAIGIVFGSNIGTTATGWIVATIGFKLDIEALALPILALGGFGVVWSRRGSRRRGISHLVIGLGLMLIGLEFMKEGTASATALFNPEALAGYPLIVFLLVGFVLTAAIQSSSATIMITLSALYAGVIELPAAAAVAIGADVGTVITTVFGALAGSNDKKRVAAAVVIFNVVINAIAFVLLAPLLYLVTDIFGISDPLYALVAFHSLFNTLGVILFIPLIAPLSLWLNRQFRRVEQPLLRHIEQKLIQAPDAAIDAVVQETCRLIDQAAGLNQASFGLPPDPTFYDSAADRSGVPLFAANSDHARAYAGLKQLEGEILAFSVQLQGAELDAEDAAKLGQIIPAIRNAVHSAKSMRDIDEDLKQFGDSVNDRFNAYLGQFREAVREFYEQLDSLRGAELPTLRFEAIVDLKNRNEAVHRRMHRRIYDEVSRGELSRVEISTLFNVNREIYVSNLALITALADALLDADAADDFAAIPVTR